jgi:hypothetical protein
MKFESVYQRSVNAVSIPDGLKESVIGPKRRKSIASMRTIKLQTLLIAVVLLVMLPVTAIAAANQLMRYGFFVNESGYTYGTIKPPMPGDDMSVSEENTPDLIACVGIDGTVGYCYKTDLDGEQPNNPEEAIEYMKRLEKRYEEMRRTGEVYVSIIPLYAEDGVTVIGEFGIGGLPED